MSKKLFGRTERKRNWGRDTRIDSWERLRLVIELMKSGLPIDVTIDVDDSAVSRPLPPPLPYDPRATSAMAIPTPLPILAEVRISLWIDETLAWMLPVHFCIDQLLTAEEVITKIADAFWFLQRWSKMYSHEAPEQIRTMRVRTRRPDQDVWPHGPVNMDLPEILLRNGQRHRKGIWRLTCSISTKEHCSAL